MTYDASVDGHDDIVTEKTVDVECDDTLKRYDGTVVRAGAESSSRATMETDTVPVALPTIGTWGAAANAVRVAEGLIHGGEPPPPPKGVDRKTLIEKKCGSHSASYSFGTHTDAEIGGVVFGVDAWVTDESAAAVTRESASGTTRTDTEEDVSSAHFTLQVKPCTPLSAKGRAPPRPRRGRGIHCSPP